MYFSTKRKCRISSFPKCRGSWGFTILKKNYSGNTPVISENEEKPPSPPVPEGLIHGKTKRTSWSAAAQRLLRALQMVCRVTVTHCSLGNHHVEYSVPYLELMMFCRACGSLVDQNANFCKGCSKGTFLNLKYTYLHLF